MRLQDDREGAPYDTILQSIRRHSAPHFPCANDPSLHAACESFPLHKMNHFLLVMTCHAQNEPFLHAQVDPHPHP